uniref:Death domain-containing protein n=1 Tax=Branchiostoma floridae TaxID=7739 RepID=C3XVB7_BRAFL|eukprot:XP_002612034.1 hypothetical protein BRAFLDRAFT_94122 [Branchiostoma floridae]
MDGLREYFFFIKENVSSDWRDLAFHLGFEQADIDNIVGRNRDDKSRCMDLLEEWLKRNGERATIEVLMEALAKANLQSTIDGLQGKYSEKLERCSVMEDQSTDAGLALAVEKRCALVDLDKKTSVSEESSKMKNGNDRQSTKQDIDEEDETGDLDPSEAPTNIPDPLPVDIFVGREQELHDLSEGLQKNRCMVLSHAVAIRAHGGTGKTSLALQYAHNHKGEYPGGLFWVVATTNRLTSDFANLANVMNHEEATKLKKAEEKIKFVQRELRTREGWLLILDNADEVSAHTQLEKLLPPRHQLKGGHIIITTRCSYVEGLKVATNIELPSLTETESIRFLQRRTGRQDEENSDKVAIKEIVSRFGGLPLLLEQAASYINKTRCTFDEYLKAIEIRGNIPLDGPSHGTNRVKRVENTFTLNFDEMPQVSRDIFHILAFCDPDEIPFEIFSVAWNSSSLADEFIDDHEVQLKAALQRTDADRAKLLELLEPIRRYSLMSFREKSCSSKAPGLYGAIHREVQRQARDCMGKATYENVLLTLVKMLAAIFQYGESAHPQLQKDLLPHAKSCLSYTTANGQHYVVAQMLLGLGQCESRLNLFVDAEKHFDKCDRLLIRHGPTEVGAKLYLEKGRLARRKEDFGRAVALLQNAYRSGVRLDRERGTVVMSLTTAEIVEELANTFIDNKSYAEAVKWFKRCEEAFQGGTTSDYNKAHFYGTYGKALAGMQNFGKAADMYEKAKALTQERDYRFPIYNTGYADMLTKKMEVKGSFNVPELEKAKEMCELSDRVIRDQNGAHHRYIAWNAGILAGILRHLPGQEDYAITKLEEAENIQRRAYGNKHEQLGNTLFQKAFNPMTRNQWASSLFCMLKRHLLRSI